jgi:hypothetical protein
MTLVKCTSCKGRHQNQPLKIGKIYNVIKCRPSNSDNYDPVYVRTIIQFLIVDETGLENWYDSERFKNLSVEEIRNYKIKILID